MLIIKAHKWKAVKLCTESYKNIPILTVKWNNMTLLYLLHNFTHFVPYIVIILLWILYELVWAAIASRYNIILYIKCHINLFIAGHGSSKWQYSYKITDLPVSDCVTSFYLKYLQYLNSTNDTLKLRLLHKYWL